MGKKAKQIRITGAAQLWDLYDQRLDVARIDFYVPERIWSALTDEEIGRIEDECADHCDDGTVTTMLFKMALEDGCVKVNCPYWEWENPFDLCGYVDYEEEECSS